MNHLPILQVIVPLISACLLVAITHRLLGRVLAIVSAYSCLGIAATMLYQVRQGQTLIYRLGGFAPPWGIEYRVDLANAYLMLLVTVIGAVVVSFGPMAGLGGRVPFGRAHLFYGTVMLTLCGLLGMAATGDAFNVFVFLEITSLSSYVLIGLGTGKRAPFAAFSYLIMGSLGGTFYLLGIGLCYQMTGTLNMADLALRLDAVEGTRTVVLGFALLGIGLCIKLAVFPLHQWLPNAYTEAPPVVSAFLAATATKVMYYVLARVIFTIFGAAYVFDMLRVDMLLVPMSVLAMLAGSMAAIYQTDIKRMLAFSSVAQVGYMMLGLSMNSELGLTAGFAHVFNHAMMKGGLFLVVACISFRIGSTTIADMAGLGRRMPLTCGAFVVGGLAMIGVPGTVGFISKWYLVLGALEKGWGGVAFLILGSSLLAVVYIWRVIEVLYFGGRDVDGKPQPVESDEAPMSMWLPTMLMIGATVYFGIHTDLTAGVSGEIARQLLGVSP